MGATATRNATTSRVPRAISRKRVVALAKQRYDDARERVHEVVTEHPERLAKGLGWFSIGLGLAQMAMPDRVAEFAGIEPTDDNLHLMRAFGMRELTAGVGILTQPVPNKWLWGRVIGDVLDLAMLGVAMGKSNDRGRTIAATVAVLGVTGLDIMAARNLSTKREIMEEEEVEIGERTIFRILTVKAHPANVEKDWEEWVSIQGSDESLEATVTFAPAPGPRGTEIRAELTYTPKAGKIGTAIQKITHKSPGQMLGQDLKHFKMMVETGEITKSDASIHKHMHPAQPDDTIGNANLVMEVAR